MTTNTSSISSVTLNDITVSAIVNEVIKNSDLAEIEKNKTKADTVASPADVKKGTYAMVNVKLMDYFVEAYNRVSSLNNKTAWAEREVITATMESEYYKKAFGSDDAYAKEIGKSASALSKIKNSIKVRDELERISGFSGYSTSFVDELISPYNKLRDDFAKFIKYSDIDLNTTVKEARAKFKHFIAVTAGEERPIKKGFFKYKAIVDGVETMVDCETEDEYKERIRIENELRLQASDDNQQASDANKSLVMELCENTKRMTVSVCGKKRNSKFIDINIDKDTMAEIFEILVAKGIVTA